MAPVRLGLADTCSRLSTRIRVETISQSDAVRSHEPHWHSYAARRAKCPVFRFTAPPFHPVVGYAIATDVESEESLDTQRVGTVVAGKWTIERPVGAGGTGTVYAAKDQNGVEVAVKFLHPEMSGFPELRERFLREAYAANRLNHPGAVRVLEHGGGGNGEEAYLVMELLRGETLGERVKRVGRLPVEELLGYLDQVLDVLAVAHGLGIVHRDLKPDNLFITVDGQLKVLDFGLARLIDRVPGEFKTRTGVALGTFAYMAPEQALGRHDQVDGRTDLFALGATSFRILSGRKVHESETQAHLLHAMASKPAPPLSSIAPDVPPAVCSVIDMALAFDKHARYPDARTMQTDVRAVRAGQPPSFALQRVSAREAVTQANFRNEPEVPAAVEPPRMLTFAGRQSAQLVAPGLPPLVQPASVAPVSMPPPMMTPPSRPSGSQNEQHPPIAQPPQQVPSAPPALREPPPSTAQRPPAIFGGAAAQPMNPPAAAPSVQPAALPSRPQIAPKNMFGFRGIGQQPAPAAPNHSSRTAPPRLVANGPLGLPPLSDAPPDVGMRPSSSGAAQDVERLLSRVGRDKSSRAPSATEKRTRATRPAHAGQSNQRWIILAVGAVGLGVLALVLAFVFTSGDKQAGASTAGANSAAGAAATGSAVTGNEPAGRALGGTDEGLKSILLQVHAYGGKEEAELRALVEEDATRAKNALKDRSCAQKGDADPNCSLARLFVDVKPLAIKKRQRDPDKPPSRWIQGLKMPTIPVEDDPRVQKTFEFYTQNTVGRETFQSMLFRCGAYRDLIQATLIRYGLPKDLVAVVMMESTCSPLAKSPVGAAGLWQFMPETARAYHLRVQDGVVDERLNPFKATEAGVRFLAQLYEKLRSWDLVFASYNLGPFGVIARLERAGGDVGFWDLVDSDLLPEETSNYAPGIQALALINENLQKLRFAGSQMRAPQMTSDLEAPAGTRLSMVARAASMSTNELKQLNLDIVGERVPSLPGGFAVQVPQDVVFQARDTLKALLAQKDDADLCVSPSFDWGKQQFKPEMAQACQRNLSKAQASR